LMPFDSDFFLITNIAMGGAFGGPVDPNFQSSSLEIDYIRVYQ
jgi:beta-glucanase (GH16 family)